jgi:hypothetical protein
MEWEEPGMEESNNSINNPSVEDWIVGTWDWKEIRIADMLAPPPNDRITPQSAGYTEQRRFLPDGQVEFYKDEEMVGTYPYRVESCRDWEPKGAPASTERYYRLYIGEKTQKVSTAEGVKEYPVFEYFTISSETLIIGRGGRDGGCGSHAIFERRK